MDETPEMEFQVLITESLRSTQANSRVKEIHNTEEKLP